MRARWRPAVNRARLFGRRVLRALDVIALVWLALCAACNFIANATTWDLPVINGNKSLRKLPLPLQGSMHHASFRSLKFLRQRQQRHHAAAAASKVWSCPTKQQAASQAPK